MMLTIFDQVWSLTSTHFPLLKTNIGKPHFTGAGKNSSTTSLMAVGQKTSHSCACIQMGGKLQILLGKKELDIYEQIKNY